MRPCFAFATSSVCAICEFWSVRGAGRSAGLAAWIAAGGGLCTAAVGDASAAAAIVTAPIHAAGLLLRTDRGPRRRRALQELVCPGDEVLPVRSVGVAAVVLPPRQLAVQQAD